MTNPIIDLSTLSYPNEELKLMYPIPGLVDVIDNSYIISNYGRIFSLIRWNNYEYREMKPSFNGDGYLQIRLSGYNGKHNYRINRLVLMYFAPIPNNISILESDHNDGNKINNYIGNLSWVTHMENMQKVASNGVNRTINDDETVKNIIQDINKGYNSSAISSKFGIPAYIVDSIKHGNSYKYISDKYMDIEIKHQIDKKLVLEIYNKSKEKIDDQKYAKEYNTSPTVIESIRLVKRYQNILKDLPPIYKDRIAVKEENALAIYYEFKKGVTILEVCKKYNIGKGTALDIKLVRNNYSFLSTKYNLPSLASPTKALSNEEAIALYLDRKNMSIEELCKKYNIGKSTLFAVCTKSGAYSFLNNIKECE